MITKEYLTDKLEAIGSPVGDIQVGKIDMLNELINDMTKVVYVPEVDTQEVIEGIGRKAIDAAKSEGLDVKEDEFTVVQPYTDTQAVLFRVAEDDEGTRGIAIDVRDAVIILPKINEHLDIYNRSEE